MSRAYRIRVRESLHRVVSADDRVSTQLELLEILPCDQMAELLKQELVRRGFEEKDGKLQRTRDGVSVTVEPETGTVTVESELREKLMLSEERETRSYTDVGPSAQKTKQLLREEIRRDLEKQAHQKQGSLQTQATDQLAGQLADLRQDLDQAVNRVTAEALKQKAAQLGQIKEMTEDPQTGSLTIVLEV